MWTWQVPGDLQDSGGEVKNETFFDIYIKLSLTRDNYNFISEIFIFYLSARILEAALCLLGSQIVTLNFNFYYIILYLSKQSCKGTINVRMKIKIFNFYLSARILEAAWCLSGSQIGTLNFIFYYIIHMVSRSGSDYSNVT